MAEFTAINTQEEFDKRIQERLVREAKKYEAYLSPDDVEKLNAKHQKEIEALNAAMADLQGKMEKHDEEIAARDAKIKGYETASAKTRIAHELGLPYDAAEFLKGDTEEDIKKSAESLKGLVKSSVVPLASNEPVQSDTKSAAYATLLSGLTGQSE